jgi:hypothetical protein
MKRTYWLGVVAAVSMLALGGCSKQESGSSSAQDTAKGLLEKVHEASEKMDTGAMVECMDPDAQKIMKDIMPLFGEMQKAAKEAASAVAQKIGKDEAMPLTAMSGGGESRSPLKAVMKDGKVDWSKVVIKEEGDKATVELDGQKADVELKKIEGKWYILMPKKEQPTADEIKKQADATKKMIASMKELTKQVNDGKITKENWAKEFGKIMGGM